MSHQSSYDAGCNLTATYNIGAGSGETSWAPVMGNSYYRNMTGWNDGPTPYGCNNTQDNLTIITSQNGFTYRNDDFTETMNANTYMLNSTGMVVEGVISTSTDKDAFKFTLSAAGNFHMDITPYAITGNDGANLDVKAVLYNASQQVIATFDPLSKLSVTIDTLLNAGTYYIMIDGSGNANTSNYGSLGSYKITGISGPLPIRSITLTGSVFKEKHNLNWSTITDDEIKTQEIEWSEDGVVFKRLTTVATNANAYSYSPNDITALYYRIKATSILNQTAYSNIISLRLNWRGLQPFIVSTFIRGQMSVNAPENFQYRLFDANGRLVTTGKGAKGFNTINFDNRSAGLYIIQLFSTSHKQTERIIKQ